MKKAVDFVVRYKKELAYVAVGLLFLYILLLITTRRPQMPVEYKRTIDSLTTLNRELIDHQNKIDSIVEIYEHKVDQVDFQIDNIKEKTTIVREYYHEIGQQAGKYSPTQVDSFFKARYNY